MNKIEKQILKNQRLLLWENYRKWESINLKHGGNGCIEMNEIIEEVKATNLLLNPKNTETTEKYIESTKDALSEETAGCEQ